MKKRVVCLIMAFVLTIMALTTWFPVSVSSTVEQTDDETTETSILLYDRIIMGIGDVYKPVFRIDVDQYYIISLNNDIVSVVMDGSDYCFIANAIGTATVLVSCHNEEGILTPYTCEVNVFEDYDALNGENYYIFSEGKKFVIAGDITTKDVYIQRWATRDDEAVWTLTPSGGYYYIHHPSLIAYLGVDENDQLHLYAPWDKEPTLWRIYADPNGCPVIVPKDHEHTNLAVGTNRTGSSVFLSDYFTDVSTKKWHMFTQIVYLDNYYDQSAIEKLDGTNYNLIRARIPEANLFAENVFDSLGVTIQSTGFQTATSDLLADSCPLGNNQPCNSSCTVAHKNIHSIFTDIEQNIPRRDRHITVMWADRRNAVYTGIDIVSEDDEERYLAAMTLPSMRETYPVVSFYTITKIGEDPISDRDETEALMSVTLAHELAHIYGIEGDPADYLVDEHGDSIHTVENGITCIMNYLSVAEANNYYQLALTGTTPYYCDHCLSILQDEIPSVMHYGN